MSELRIVSPQEAQAALESEDVQLAAYVLGDTCLLTTVATEPERIEQAERAAVVKALRWAQTQHWNAIQLRANAIENGADY